MINFEEMVYGFSALFFAFWSVFYQTRKHSDCLETDLRNLLKPKNASDHLKLFVYKHPLLFSMFGWSANYPIALIGLFLLITTPIPGPDFVAYIVKGLITLLMVFFLVMLKVSEIMSIRVGPVYVLEPLLGQEGRLKLHIKKTKEMSELAFMLKSIKQLRKLIPLLVKLDPSIRNEKVIIDSWLIQELETQKNGFDNAFPTFQNIRTIEINRKVGKVENIGLSLTGKRNGATYKAKATLDLTGLNYKTVIVP